MKILVSCYACSPYKGSEPGMGWNFLKAICRDHELHIITESKFKADLDKYFAEHPKEKQYFRFYFLRKERHKKLRKVWPMSYYWFYNAWQKKAFKLAKELDEKENFDIVHQLNMVGYREPGYLWKMEKPVVWGPIGGFNITPWQLLHALGLYGSVFYGFRNLINLFQMHCKKRVRRAMRDCREVISASQDTHDAVLKIYGRETKIIPEVGLVVEGVSEETLPKRIEGERLRLSWSGQHTPSKALNILFNALLACRCRDKVEIHVMGKGQYTTRWKRLAKKLGIEQHVVWHGWIDRTEAMNIMKTCHGMVITSLSDLTSTVLLEALSLGLPVIALNHCGFANVITDNCGIKIPISKYFDVVNGFAEAIDSLYEYEDKRQKLSIGALERAKDFSWDAKRKELNEIYNKVRI